MIKNRNFTNNNLESTVEILHFGSSTPDTLVPLQVLPQLHPFRNLIPVLWTKDLGEVNEIDREKYNYSDLYEALSETF